MRLSFSDCILDTAARSFTRSGEVLGLEPQVFDLLQLLAENPDRVVTKDEIVERVWGGRIVSESAISARVAAARKAVGDDGKRQAIIRTVARRGLQFVAALQAAPPVEPAPQSPAHPPVLSPGLPAVQRIRHARNGQGHRIAYSVLGEGPPVLRFGPPLTTDLEFEYTSGIDWSCIRPLAACVQYCRFDHVGSGQSERATPTFDFEDQAHDAARVADAAGFDRFAGISFSGGALAAIHFATLYPDRLTRLVIVGGYSEGRMRREGPATTPGRTDPLKGLIEAGWNDLEGAFATAFMTTYFPEGPLADARTMVRQMQLACPLDAMMKDRDYINDASVLDLLPRVRCPVLVLHSKNERVHPLSEAQKLAAGIPGAELVVLDCANHVPLPENPVWDSFVATITDFLTG